MNKDETVILLQNANRHKLPNRLSGSSSNLTNSSWTKINRVV